MEIKDIPDQPDGTKLICTDGELSFWTIGKEYIVKDNRIYDDDGVPRRLGIHYTANIQFDVIPPQPKFIRSVMKNSEEAQLGLFSLGYIWTASGNNIYNMDYEYLYTNEDGLLGCSSYEPSPEIPVDQFEFNTTVTAKMKPQPTETPIQKEIAEIEKQQRELADRLNKLKSEL